MKKTIFGASLLLAASLPANSQIMNNPNTNTSLAPVEQLTLTEK